MRIKFEYYDEDYQGDVKGSLPLEVVENLFTLWKKYGKFITDKLKLDEITFKL